MIGENITAESVHADFKPVEFRGNGSEYFGIWIVNLLLSILTLGIYSAWAKVRTNQYFYSNTLVDGHSFGYHAVPMQILKGRILAIGLFVLYNLLSAVNPILALAGALLFAVLLPWIIVVALRFRLRMTSYRNVRFAFRGDMGEAFIYYMMLPGLVITASVMLATFGAAIFQRDLTAQMIAMGLAALLWLASFPQIILRKDRWRFGNIQYGRTPLVRANFEVMPYYGALLAAVAAVATLVALAVAAMTTLGLNEGDLKNDPNSVVGLTILILVLYLFALFFAIAVYTAIVRNHQFNNLVIPNLAKTRSNVNIRSYLALMLGNGCLLLITLGFAYPWVMVRTVRYLANHTQVRVDPAIEEVLGRTENADAAFADEASEVFDMDIGLA